MQVASAKKHEQPVPICALLEQGTTIYQMIAVKLQVVILNFSWRTCTVPLAPQRNHTER